MAPRNLRSCPSVFEAREICPRCRRPVRVCWCAHVTPLLTRTRVVVLQHPRERRVPVGTAPIVRACLPDSKLLVGIEFEGRPDFEAALADPEHPPVLLFPGPEARDLATQRPEAPPTLVVVDGTWSQAKQLISRNPRLAALPRYALAPTQPSTYRIRHAPAPQFLSTLEALAAALGALEGEPSRFQALLAPFTAMVERQLEHASERAGEASRHKQRWAGVDKPPRIPAVFGRRARDLVCVSVEANAWNQSRPGGGADELVHAVALRFATGDSFEAIVAPRAPLSPSTPHHIGIDAARLEAGLSTSELRERWRGFVRDDDILVYWGTYVFELLRAEGCVLPATTIDLRKVFGDVQQSPPRSLERTLADAGIPQPQSPADGRAGERLHQLAAATQWLCAHARSAGR